MVGIQGFCHSSGQSPTEHIFPLVSVQIVGYCIVLSIHIMIKAGYTFIHRRYISWPYFCTFYKMTYLKSLMLGGMWNPKIMNKYQWSVMPYFLVGMYIPLLYKQIF